MINSPSVKLLQYGITNDKAWEVGLACGGDIKIRIESLKNNG
jgi:xanthine/CO dehydrogenase XdhC/CoxF family maturation factor